MNTRTTDPLARAAAIKARLAEIEGLRNASYWAAHMLSARYKPVPMVIYQERNALLDELIELENKVLTTQAACFMISPLVKEIEMKSKQVKAAYATHGMTVRVRDLGPKFRICGVTQEIRELVESVAVGLGLTDCVLNAGGQWNGRAEFIAYKPGAVVRL